MPTVEEFRSALKGADPFDIVERFLLDDNALHVSAENIEYIRRALAASYGVNADDVQVIITGSAKLGFSVTEKRRPSGDLLRYRPFSPLSDIDVAVISSPIFDVLWHELSAYSHRAVRLPHDTGPLGDYLVCGWIRPDHFPKDVRLPYCDSWWDTFKRLSANSRFNRRQVRGGAFNSITHLNQYLVRAVRECIIQEEAQ